MIYNPLLGSVRKLSDDKLREKIRDLTRKYYMTRDQYLRDQIQGLLETHVEEQTRRLNDRNQSTDEFDNLIDIN